VLDVRQESMKTYLFLLFGAAILSSCTLTTVQPISDADYAERIVGTWVIPQDERKTFKSEITYYGNGTAKGYYIQGSWTNDGVFVTKYNIRFKQRWRIKDGVVEGFDYSSAPKKMFKPGEVIRDKIVYISKKQAKYIGMETNEPFFRYRKLYCLTNSSSRLPKVSRLLHKNAKAPTLSSAADEGVM